MEKTDSEKEPGAEGEVVTGGVSVSSSPSSCSPPAVPVSSDPHNNNDQQNASASSSTNNPLYCSYVDGQFTYKDPGSGVQYVWNESEKKWVVKAEEASSIDSNKLAEREEGQDDAATAAQGGDVISPSSTGGTSQVHFDGESYTYTDQDGTVFLWDAGKGAWFPKDLSTVDQRGGGSSLRNNNTSSSLLSSSLTSAATSHFSLPPSPPDLSSSLQNQTIGFFNPNYATTLTSPNNESSGGGGGGGSCGATNHNNAASESDSNTPAGGGGGPGTSSRRFYYASLSPTSMGVNENPGLFLSPDDQVNNNDQVVQSIAGGGGGIPGLEQGGDVTDGVAATASGGGEESHQEQIVKDIKPDPLPPGWEKHEDTNGPYYWHVKSGTIQRERPTVNSPVVSSIVMSRNDPALMIPGGMDGGISGFVRRSNTVVGGLGGSGTSSNNNNNINNGGGMGSESTVNKRRSWVSSVEEPNNGINSGGGIGRGLFGGGGDGEGGGGGSSGVTGPRTTRSASLCHQQQQHVDFTNSLPAYEFDKHALKFAAISLGCLSISEEDLTPERSSRAVSKVIAELTSGGCGGVGVGGMGVGVVGGLGGSNKENNKAGGMMGSNNCAGPEHPSRIWTHTDAITTAQSTGQQQMYLELTDSHLRVKVHRLSGTGDSSSSTTSSSMSIAATTHHHHHNPHTTSTLTVLEQPIHSIRVWGVGREDPRDFAFVAREKQTRQFMCHVFRLDMYARPLASSLRDACKKIMIERQARVSAGGGGGGSGGSGVAGKRPTSLGLKKNHNGSGGGGDRGSSHQTGNTGSSSGAVTSGLLFPTPMDEPRKMIKAFYLGSKNVGKPTGMEVLNGAINGLKAFGVEKIPVLVSVAPSVIGITSTTESPPKVQLEVRVRFLSFMGIGSDIRTCGIIIHTSRDDFEAHCFYSTPSTGALCKAIEAACVLRYQKCLDAHNHHHVGGGGSAGTGTIETGSGGGGGGSGGNKDCPRGNSTASGGGMDSNGCSLSSSTATSPKSAAVIASATASNLASALKTVFSNFGKTKSVEEK